MLSPTYLTSPPGDRDRLFVTEQPGWIRIINIEGVVEEPFLNLTDRVEFGGEQGLLGLAFHPDYDTNGYFYVCYTRKPDGASMLERYTVSEDPNFADPASRTVLLGPVTQPGVTHNGGCLQFGPDGKLYLGFGDGGAAPCAAQDGQNLLGCMIRLNDDGSIPASNPFVGDPAVRDEVWSFGFRNPWRFSFDRVKGDLYIGDVGNSTTEEISFQFGTSSGGQNYGWPIMEGNGCFGFANCTGAPPCFSPLLEDPIYDYDHLSGDCSVTGGYVYRGCAIPDLQGTYFFADFCSAKVWSFRYFLGAINNFTDRSAELTPPFGALNFISSFGEDADGELYIVELTGEIWKIVPNLPPVFNNLGFRLPGSTSGMRLDICGRLNQGQTASLRVFNALPNAPIVMAASFQNSPIEIFGGTIVPGGPSLVGFPLTSSSEGSVEIPLLGGGGPFDVFVQFLQVDPGAPLNLAFSNAIRGIWQP